LCLIPNSLLVHKPLPSNTFILLFFISLSFCCVSWVTVLFLSLSAPHCLEYSLFFTQSHATDTRHSAARAPLVGDSRIFGIISSMPPLLFCTFEMDVYECSYIKKHQIFIGLFCKECTEMFWTLLCA